MRSRSTRRTEQVGDQIQRELARIILRDLADPAVGPVTLSGVDLSPDLRQAKIYVTPAKDSDGQSSVYGLNRAAAFLRRRLGARLRTRVLPQLRFVYDPTLDEAHRIDALLDGAMKRESAGAALPGEEDPPAKERAPVGGGGSAR